MSRSPIARFATDNPVGLVLCGLAIGVVIGSIAPVSQNEREKIAPLRDDVVGRAQRAAELAVEHGKGVLDETVAAVTSSATQHGHELAEGVADLTR